jgi:putative flippase GtrA
LSENKEQRLSPVVIIPALDPSPALTGLIAGLRTHGFSRIVVVNDGSAPAATPIFEQAEQTGCRVLHHEVNLGKGAALKTAIRFAHDTWPDAPGYLTADADGQHSVPDITKTAAALTTAPDSLIMGTRNFNQKDVPFKSRWGNRITSFVFKLESGVKCPDTQTGLRGLPASQTDLLLATAGERFDYEMNMLLEFAHRDIPFVEVPIETIYEDNNSGSHFNAVRDSIRIYLGILRFAASSLISAGFDLVMFALLTKLVFASIPLEIEGYELHTAAATVIARITSGILNYSLNRRLVFHDRNRVTLSAPRYLILFIAIMLVSATATQLLDYVSFLPTILLKIAVDAVLFLVNYYIQKHFVFAGRRKR